MDRNYIIIKVLIGISALAFLLQACTEEIDLYAPPETSPVVYALLDADYDTQYIRVGQTFFYQGQDSILSNPKLTHLDEDFEVYITYTDNNGSNKIIWFEPHDGVTRDSGLFAPEELQLLSAKMEVQNSTIYKFYLHLKKSGKIVYGQLKSFDEKLQVIDPLDVSFRTINLYTDEDFYFRFVPVSNKAVYQAILTFNYHEVQQGIFSEHSLDFPLEIVYGEGQEVFFVGDRFSGESFLRDIGQRIEPKEGISRIPIGLNFHISAGGEEMYYLIKSANRQFGFSAMSNTNLQNGIGVFSTLSHRYINDILFSEHSIDSLAMSQYTKHLGFEPYSKQEP